MSTLITRETETETVSKVSKFGRIKRAVKRSFVGFGMVVAAGNGAQINEEEWRAVETGEVLDGPSNGLQC